MYRRHYVRAAANRNSADADNGAKTMSASLSTLKGKTRGRNPREIEYQAFDNSKPDTIPTSIKEFMVVTGVQKEPTLVEYLVEGFNQAQYSAATDEIGEFINPAWSEAEQAQFRLAVRNYSKLVGVSIEDAVNLIKPGVDKAFEARKTAESAPATA